MEGEKIFAKKMTDKRLFPKILKQLMQFYIQKKKKEKKIKSKSGQKI